MPSGADLNPFANIGTGGSLGTYGSIALIIAISVVVLGLIGFFIYWRSVKKNFWIRIHVFRLIGNIPTRVAVYSAKEVSFGMAGDKLWKVAPTGMMQMFKAIKWLPVGKIQTASKEFWYFIREDGEWINFGLDDLNAIQKKAGVRFVQEDMRLQRLATERLLEQRLMKKTFWEQWGTTVMLVLFFLVISVCMVIIFYQFGKLLDELTLVESTQLEISKILYKTFGENYVSNFTGAGGSGLIPA
jgi:hypothetical protein